MELLRSTIAAIGDLNQTMVEKAQQRLDQLTKPPGSLGKLETTAIKLAGITEELYPDLSSRQLVLFAADHGVVEEGVSAFPQEVTEAMVLNFLNNGAAVNVFAKQARTEIKLVDIGMKADLEHPNLHKHKVKPGTNNFCHGPAMTRSEAVQALEIGIQMAKEAQKEGVRILATGEMGIGNTTASSALASVLGQVPVETVVGRGTGLDSEGVQIKIRAITRGIELNNPDHLDPIDTLAKLGGLEIAGLTGLILGAATCRIPIVIDGFISTAAALVAAKLAPKSTNFMIASHASVEPGHKRVLQEIDLEPMIYMDMRLGEGTGAVLALHLVDAAVLVIEGMATFAEAGISS